MGLKTIKILPKNQITLPKDLRDKLHTNVGDKVVFVETENGLLVKKVTEETIQKLINSNMSK